MGVDVEAAVGDRLLDDLVSEIAQAAGQPVAGLPFTSGGGIDVDETARSARPGSIVVAIVQREPLPPAS